MCHSQLLDPNMLLLLGSKMQLLYVKKRGREMVPIQAYGILALLG